LGIQNSTYYYLTADTGSELHWFCESFADMMKLEEDNVVMNVLCNLAKQLAHVEQKLHIKVDCTK